MSDETLRRAIEEEAAIALAEDSAAQWVVGAINPCEMAFFVATCRVAGVRRIVESGRQDGFSTAVLGRAAARTGISVASIDLELDADRARACRERLAKLDLKLIRGDAYRAVGEAVVASDEPTALLIDGPKGFPALAMLLAAGRLAHVRVLALHNLGVETPWLPFFRGLGATARLHEDVPGLDASPAWTQLRRAETARFVEVLGRGAVRGESTLGVLALPPERPLPGFARPFAFHQPALLAALWRLGAHVIARRCFVASFHVFGNK